jgi:hypothetical protein
MNTADRIVLAFLALTVLILAAHALWVKAVLSRHRRRNRK